MAFSLSQQQLFLRNWTGRHLWGSRSWVGFWKGKKLCFQLIKQNFQRSENFDFMFFGYINFPSHSQRHVPFPVGSRGKVNDLTFKWDTFRESAMKEFSSCFGGMPFCTSFHSLQLNNQAPKEVLLQTQILNSLNWAVKGIYVDIDQNFVPSLAERVSFAAFQPISGKFSLNRTTYLLSFSSWTCSLSFYNRSSNFLFRKKLSFKVNMI